MRKEGFRSIVQALSTSDYTLSELAKKTKLSKGSVSYHLDKLKELDFIKDKTKNNLVNRGVIEKIFGGIGRGPLAESSP